MVEAHIVTTVTNYDKEVERVISSDGALRVLNSGDEVRSGDDTDQSALADDE